MPNAIARSLQSQRTDLIALAVEDIGNPVYVAMMRAIEAVVAESGRQLVVHATGGQVASETALLRRLAHRYVDGMIISPIRVTDAHLDAIGRQPGRRSWSSANCPRTCRSTTCAPTRGSGIALAVDHLVAQGRRRIGFVNGPLDTVPGAARDAGFRAALAAHGIAVDDEPGRGRRLPVRGRPRRRRAAAGPRRARTPWSAPTT